MWFLLIFIAILLFSLAFAMQAGNGEKGNIHKTQNNSQFLSSQTGERSGTKKRGKFDSKTEYNKNKKRKKLAPCGTRSSVDTAGMSLHNTSTFPSETAIRPNSSGYMTKKQLSCYSKYLKGELFVDYLVSKSDSSLIKVSEKDFAEMLAEKEYYEKFDLELTETAENNNKGIAYEKEGKIDQAIFSYEKNLEIAYPALHSYERLMILYRKQKRYDDEIRVIKKAIKDFPVETYKAYIKKWEERLVKSENMRNKI